MFVPPRPPRICKYLVRLYRHTPISRHTLSVQHVLHVILHTYDAPSFVAGVLLQDNTNSTQQYSYYSSKTLPRCMTRPNLHVHYILTTTMHGTSDRFYRIPSPLGYRGNGYQVHAQASAGYTCTVPVVYLLPVPGAYLFHPHYNAPTSSHRSM